MRKLIILVILLVAAVMAAASLYFSKLGIAARNNGYLLSFIPSDASYVASFRNDKATHEIFNGYPLFNDLLGNDMAGKLSQLQDTLLAQPQIAQLITGNNLYFSFHPFIGNDLAVLFLSTLNKNISGEEEEALFQHIQGVSAARIELAGRQVWRLTFTSKKQNLYIFIQKNTVAASYSRALLEKSLHPTSRISRQFIDQINAGGQKNENSPLNIYLNHASAKTYIQSFYKEKRSDDFSILTGLSGFSSLNMNYKSDALMFNGISRLENSDSLYPGLFLHQNPVTHTLIKSLPQITAAYMAFGLSDYRKFLSDLEILLQKRGELEKLKQQIQSVKKETGIDLDRDLKPYLGNEFALVQFSNQEKLAVINVKNGEKVNFFLQPVSSAFSPDIRHINYSNIFYNYFGDPLKPFVKPFFAIADNNLILSNSATAIRQFLEAYSHESLLVNTGDYNDFMKYTANQSNISIFLNTKNFRQIAASDLRNALSYKFNKDKQDLRKFYGISLQLSSAGGHFLTNFYAGLISPEQKTSDLETDTLSGNSLKQ